MKILAPYHTNKNSEYKIKKQLPEKTAAGCYKFINNFGLTGVLFLCTS